MRHWIQHILATDMIANSSGRSSAHCQLDKVLLLIQITTSSLSVCVIYSLWRGLELFRHVTIKFNSIIYKLNTIKTAPDGCKGDCRPSRDWT